MKKVEEKHKLEDYEPGASREEVHSALRLVTKPTEKTKKPQKPTSQSGQA